MGKLKIGFIWFGSSDKHTFEHWNDGLRQAMRYIEKEHDVSYLEPTDNLDGYDVLLLWEAPCTINNKDYEPWYRAVQFHTGKKALLFAGGPMLRDGLDGFDIIFTESQVNDDELIRMGYTFRRAFGINDLVFKPLDVPRIYGGIHPATCASWKRQGLLCKALKKRAVVCGRNQETDPTPFQECEKQGSTLLGELSYPEVNKALNQSQAMINTADLWGGGQRATLEAMATNTPPIVMSDSPKNKEYVEESGYGIIAEPNEEAIRGALRLVESFTEEQRNQGRKYIENKWTARHYADSLLEGIKSIL